MGTPFDPEVLRYLCETTWVNLGVGWPPQGSFNEEILAQVHHLVSRDLKQFSDIDSWRISMARNPKWLRKLRSKATGLFPARVVQSQRKPRSQACLDPDEEWSAPPPYCPPRTPATGPDPAASDNQQGASTSAATERRTYVTTATLKELAQTVPQPDRSNQATLIQLLPSSDEYPVNQRSHSPSCSRDPQDQSPIWTNCYLPVVILPPEKEHPCNEAIKDLKLKAPAEQYQGAWTAATCPPKAPERSCENGEQPEKPTRIMQKANESPDQFYKRLLKAYQHHTSLQASDPTTQRLISMAFIVQS